MVTKDMFVNESVYQKVADAFDKNRCMYKGVIKRRMDLSAVLEIIKEVNVEQPKGYFHDIDNLCMLASRIVMDEDY